MWELLRIPQISLGDGREQLPDSDSEGSKYSDDEQEYRTLLPSVSSCHNTSFRTDINDLLFIIDHRYRENSGKSI